jgi:hypothetical protein
MCQDIDATSQQYLIQNSPAAACVFGDILDGFEVRLSDDMSYMEQVQAMQDAHLLGLQWCFKHQRFCRLRSGQIDATGLPCTDFSASGRGDGIHGKTMKVWLAHLRKHTILDTPLLVLENTPRCPTSLVQVNLPNHEVFRLEVSPADCGFGLCARQRSYFLAVSRNKADMVYDWHDVYSMMTQHMQTKTPTTPRDAIQAGDDEINDEGDCLARSRGIVWTGRWVDLLTQNQHDYLQRYLQEYGSRFGPGCLQDFDACFNLGDNPANRLNWSCCSGRIPTFRLSSSMFWYPALRRPLTTLEKLAVMGWPVYPSLASPDMVPIVPSLQQARHMLGNAWHLANGSTVMLSALACTRLRLPGASLV